MFPYRDDNVSIRTPLITFLIIAANVAAWMLIQGAGSPLPLAKSVCNLGLVAGELTGQLRPGTSFPMGDGGFPDGRQQFSRWATVVVVPAKAGTQFRKNKTGPPPSRGRLLRIL